MEEIESDQAKMHLNKINPNDNWVYWDQGTAVVELWYMIKSLLF